MLEGTFSQPKNKKEEPAEKQPFKIGDTVVVQRSNGTLEEGFRVTAFNSDGTVSVQKKIPGTENITGKRIPLSELESLNPPRLTNK